VHLVGLYYASTVYHNARFTVCEIQQCEFEAGLLPLQHTVRLLECSIEVQMFSVLSCVGRSLANDRSPLQGLLPNVDK